MKAAYSPNGIAIRNGQDVQVTLSARGVFVPHIASGQMVGQPETAPLPSGLLVIVRHERERLRGRVVRNCLTDEGRPLGTGCRSRFQTISGGCGQKPWW